MLKFLFDSWHFLKDSFFLVTVSIHVLILSIDIHWALPLLVILCNKMFQETDILNVNRPGKIKTKNIQQIFPKEVTADFEKLTV